MNGETNSECAVKNYKNGKWMKWKDPGKRNNGGEARLDKQKEKRQAESNVIEGKRKELEITNNSRA